MNTPHRRLSELFLLAVANGLVDPLEEPGVVERLVILRGRYGHIDRMVALLDDACDAYVAADLARDVAFLGGLIDGTADYFSDDLYDRLEPLYEKYKDDAALLDLFNRAATAYADAVVAAATWAMAAWTIEDAKRRARGDEE